MPPAAPATPGESTAADATAAPATPGESTAADATAAPATPGESTGCAPLSLNLDKLSSR